MRLSIVVFVCVCVHFSKVSLHPQSSSTHLDKNESWKALELAINTENENELQRLLMDTDNLNVTDQNGDTALILAAKRGFEKMVRLLLEKGANINAVNKDNFSALIYAAWNGNENVVRVLVENGADVNIVNKMNDNNALLAALSEGNEKIAEILLQKDVDVNYVMSSGSTALTYAVNYGLDKIVQMLIKKGANVNAGNKDHRSAIIYAARNGHLNIVSQLIESGADINAVDTDNNTVLILAISAGHDKVAELLIEKGSNVNAVAEKNNSALILAAADGHENVVRMLVDKGANINAVNIDNDTALISAISAGFDKVAELLIQKGADVNIVGKSGRSALMHAAIQGRKRFENVVQILMDKGANLNARDSNGDTALTLAAAEGNSGVLLWLTNDGLLEIDAFNNHSNDTALIKAISRKDFEVAHLLIWRRADIDAVGDNGFTPLLKAAKVGNVEIAPELFDYGANVNATNDDGESALNLAAQNDHLELFKMLIENGADINHKGAYDRTPLINVARAMRSRCPNNCQGYKEVLQMLIDKGANVNAVDKDSQTALDAVFEVNESEDREEVIRLLTQHGAERGAALLYRKTAVKACRLYSNLTARWNYGIVDRVSGGSLAETGEFPWMVALGYLSDQYKVSFSCGGSLISDIFVLTAAHCVKDNRRPVVARLGKVTLTDEDDFRAENQNIREIILHPKYSLNFRKNDIALIRLVDRQWITKFIQPVCIQTQLRDEPIQTNLIVTGWGQVNKSSTSTELLKVDLKTMPLSQCNETFWNYNKKRDLPAFRHGIDGSQYCAHDPLGRKDSCQGDSGGPLQTPQTFSNPVKVVGVVSFGIGCSSGYPGIYTRVAHYIDWIGSHVWPNGEIPTPRVYITEDENDGNDVYIWNTK